MREKWAGNGAGEADLHWPQTKIMWCHFISIQGLFPPPPSTSGLRYLMISAQWRWRMKSCSFKNLSVLGNLPEEVLRSSGSKPCPTVATDQIGGTLQTNLWKMARTVIGLKFWWAASSLGCAPTLGGICFLHFENNLWLFPIGMLFSF